MTIKRTAIDWVDLLVQLEAAGITVADISKASGIPRETLRGYREFGSQPPHWRGEVLIAVWCIKLGRKRDELPITEVYLAPRVTSAT